MHSSLLVPILCIAIVPVAVTAVYNSDFDNPTLPILLLGGNLDIVHTFISDSFGVRCALLRDSVRDDRAIWTRIRRRWLPLDDIDRILKINASAASDDGPLRLGYDVVLERSRRIDGVVEQISSMCQHCGNVIDLPKVHDAFRDGFSVRVRLLDRRLLAVATATQDLREYWHAPVETELTFAPPNQRDLGNFRFDPVQNHEFWVQLDGEQNVRVRVPGEKESENILTEGDVLYVPPNGRVSRKGRRAAISTHIRFSIGPLPKRIDGIRTAIDTVQASVLDEPLPGEDTFTWRTLVQAAVSSVASSITDLELPLPVSPQASLLIHEATGVTPTDTLRAELTRFAQAAEQSVLIVPVIEDLGEKADRLGMWARELKSNRRVGRNTHQQIVTMFHRCLRYLGTTGSASEDAIRIMRDTANKEQTAKRNDRRDEVDSLRRHGEKVHIRRRRP